MPFFISNPSATIPQFLLYYLKLLIKEITNANFDDFVELITRYPRKSSVTGGIPYIAVSTWQLTSSNSLRNRAKSSIGKLEAEAVPVYPATKTINRSVCLTLLPG